MTVEGISQKRESSTLHSCLKRVTYSFTRKQRQRRVKFSDPLTSEEWNSVWKSKNELHHYKMELRRRYPSAPFCVRAVRRRGYQEQKRVIEKKKRAVSHFFDINPLGVANQDNMEPLSLMIAKEVKSIKEELLFAPVIFKTIHPFDTIMVSYFNSIGKSKLDSPCGPYIRKKDPKCAREQSLYPSRFLPLIIERDLWRFRQAQFRQHFSDLLRSQGKRQCNHSQLSMLVQDMAAKGVLSPYVADPFAFFRKEIKYEDHSVSGGYMEEIKSSDEDDEWKELSLVEEDEDDWRDVSPEEKLKLEEEFNATSDELQWIIEEKIRRDDDSEEENDENQYFALEHFNEITSSPMYR